MFLIQGRTKIDVGGKRRKVKLTHLMFWSQLIVHMLITTYGKRIKSPNLTGWQKHANVCLSDVSAGPAGLGLPPHEV